ncbi:hypothetical protein [Tropicibacter oceani]|uniref:DUF4177 domain-containing protein n=1 Tax=Tropicibacter oceani TaxID=3058420 RepID=A0ABY8QHK2_9RHOB|nr:hypothetical protein [Tropicibacter oceani]WGW03282.1 hypothetical protein QF118_15315 [Tropicibacter oceani]
MQFEYKVVPAPAKGEKAPGAKSAEARFAHAVERIMNEMAASGWEYLRSDTLPSEERAGLTQTQTVWRNLLVFRKAAQQAAAPKEPQLLAPPDPAFQGGPTPQAQRPAPAEEDSEPALPGLPGALVSRAQRLRQGQA